MLPIERLRELIVDPEFHQRILSDYEGPYSIGITSDPKNERRLAIRVRIHEKALQNIRNEIEVDGYSVPVIVNTSYERPVVALQTGALSQGRLVVNQRDREFHTACDYDYK